MSSNESSMRRFYHLLLAQTVSLLATSLTGFVLGIWAYEQAGSVTLYSMIALANTLPMVLLSPLAGTMVDRFERKHILLAGQCVGLLSIALMAALHAFDQLSVWHIVVLSVVNSAFSAFVMPTIAVIVPLVVPKENLTRANGAISLGTGITQLVAPALAGILLLQIGLGGIFVCNIVALVFSLVIVLRTYIPPSGHAPSTGHPHLLASMREGWNYVRERPSLMAMIIFYMAVAFNIYAITVLLAPMVLGFTDARGLGIVASTTGIGMIIGAFIAMSLTSLPRKIYGVLGAASVISFGIILLSIWPKAWTVALSGLMVLAAFPVVTACSQTIFQTKIPNSMQGRVFGVRNFLVGGMQPLAIAAAGPLADKVFEPGMKSGGELVPWFGAVFGVGDGRGIAVMIGILGLMTLCWTLIAAATSVLRDIEDKLPDVDHPPIGGLHPAENPA